MKNIAKLIDEEANTKNKLLKEKLKKLEKREKDIENIFKGKLRLRLLMRVLL